MPPKNRQYTTAYPILPRLTHGFTPGTLVSAPAKVCVLLCNFFASTATALKADLFTRPTPEVVTTTSPNSFTFGCNGDIDLYPFSFS